MNVFSTIILTIILSLGLLSYSIIKKNKAVPCISADILIFGQRNTGNKIYYVGDQLLFRVAANVSDKVVWDFGDNSSKVQEAGTRHTFQNEHIYLVTATVNGKCAYNLKVNIKKKENTIIDSSGNVIQPIVGETNAIVGDEVTFTTSLKATSYKWTIENKSGYPVKTSQDAIFTFRSKGVFIIGLMINDDRQKKYTYMVTVSPPPYLLDSIPTVNPPAPVPQPILHPDSSDISGKPPLPPAPNIEPVKSITLTDDDGIKDVLQNFLCFKADINKYLFYGGATQVIATIGKKITNTTVNNMCRDLNKNDCDNIKILKLTTNRESNNEKNISAIFLNFDIVKSKKACPND